MKTRKFKKIKSKEGRNLFSTNVIDVLLYYYRMQQSTDGENFSTIILKNVEVWQRVAKYSVLV